MKTSGTQTSAAVMVVLLCCTIFKGTFSSSNDNEQNDSILHELNDEFDYSTPSCKLYKKLDHVSQEFEIQINHEY